MERRYEGKTVLITGAARGFGRLAALSFVMEGAQVALTDMREDLLAETKKDIEALGGRAITLAGDISVEATSRDLVAKALDAFGTLDVAINNAGIGGGFNKLANIETETMEKLLAVNVMGVFFGLKYQVPVMEAKGDGAILNVSSVAGLVGSPMLAGYSAAKHAVIGLTKSVAGELARKNVRVNAICPAFTATNMVMDSVSEMRDGPDAAIQRIVSNMPMRRIADPQEIVQAMLWICSPANSFMTGHSLAVDGGLSAV